MSEPGSPEHPAPDAEAMESLPGTDQGDTPKKGRKNKGEKKPIPQMKLTVDVQQWLRKENRKAVKEKDVLALCPRYFDDVLQVL